MINKCPGHDPKKLEAKNIKCPSCGYEIEIFSDEVKACCPRCKSTKYLDRMPSCIDWCKSAKECVGEGYYKTYMETKSALLKEKLIKELEDYFGQDEKRINHAKKVMDFAEDILKQEKADWDIVMPASILHDVGIKVAEAKYGSAAGHYQEKEGPEVARKILLKLGVKKDNIDEICSIIAHHHSPEKINTQNFKVLYDADWLVNLKEEVDTNDEAKLKDIIHKVFFTDTGRVLAKKLYLSESKVINQGKEIL